MRRILGIIAVLLSDFVHRSIPGKRREYLEFTTDTYMYFRLRMYVYQDVGVSTLVALSKHLVGILSQAAPGEGTKRARGDRRGGAGTVTCKGSATKQRLEYWVKRLAN